MPRLEAVYWFVGELENEPGEDSTAIPHQEIRTNDIDLPLLTVAA